MSENINNTVAETVDESKDVTYTVEYILGQMEAIRKSGEQLSSILEEIKKLDEVQADSFARVAHSREETNCQLLKMYEKMYEDLFTKEKDRRAEKISLVKSIAFDFLEVLKESADEVDVDEYLNSIRNMIESVCMDVLADRI